MSHTLVNVKDKVPFNALSKFYGKDKSSFRKWMLKEGFKLHKVKGYDRRFALQTVLAVSMSDLPRIGELRGSTMTVIDQHWYQNDGK